MASHMAQHTLSSGAIEKAVTHAARRSPARQACRRLTVSMAVTYDKVSGAYANALVDLAQQKGNLSVVHSDIDYFSNIFKENPSTVEFLNNPMVPKDRKKELLKSLAKDVSPDTLNFLHLLLDLDRFVAVDQIFSSFQQSYCKANQTLVVKVVSAALMKQEQMFLMAKKLQELTGTKNVKLEPSVDRSLISGFTIEFGSSKIDLSLRGQLAKIEAELLEAQPAHS